MAKYIAVHHVILPGGPALPGEDLRADDVAKLGEAKIERLLKLGAIREAAPGAAEDEAPAEAETEEERDRRLARENYAQQLEKNGYGPDGNPIPDDAEKPENEPDEEPEDEPGEEPEAPEIDVMDGIVRDEEAAPQPEAPKPPKKRGGRGKTK